MRYKERSSRRSKIGETVRGTERVRVINSVEVRSRFGARVRALLEEKGIASEELAKWCSLSPSRLYRILHGRLIPITFRDMTIIAAVLGTPLSALLVSADPSVEVVPLEVIEKRGSSDA
jgi:transcriptional regulator with XRE-family HTH domain